MASGRAGCVAMHCLSLPCVAMRCLALRCIAPAGRGVATKGKAMQMQGPRSPRDLQVISLAVIYGVMSEVTRILGAIEQGDPHAAGQLLPLVYNELRRLAARKLACEKPGHTLDATALV